jgi:hypothetical protein
MNRQRGLAPHFLIMVSISLDGAEPAILERSWQTFAFYLLDGSEQGKRA